MKFKTVNLNEEIHLKIKKLAKQNGMTIPAFISHLVLMYIDSHKENQR